MTTERTELVESFARFLLDAGYGTDFEFTGVRPPVEVLERMVELAADDPMMVVQDEPRNPRLAGAYFVLSSELGEWR